MRRFGLASCSIALGMLLGAGACLAQTSAEESTLVNRWRQLEANPALTAAAVKAGGKTATFCANCHGANGNSITPETPNLAGQLPAYMLAQMSFFMEGRRRHEFMQGLLKAMSVDEKVNVAMYYTRQNVNVKTDHDAESRQLLASGKRYYDQVCFRCHGAEGRGDAKIPRIAGQQMTYMKLSLKRYRDGSDIRMDPLMAASTRLMKDTDIDAVALYVSSMK